MTAIEEQTRVAFRSMEEVFAHNLEFPGTEYLDRYQCQFTVRPNPANDPEITIRPIMHRNTAYRADDVYPAYHVRTLAAPARQPEVGDQVADYEEAVRFEQAHRGSTYEGADSESYSFRPDFETSRYPVLVSNQYHFKRRQVLTASFPWTITSIGSGPVPEPVMTRFKIGQTLTNADLDGLPTGSRVDHRGFYGGAAWWIKGETTWAYKEQGAHSTSRVRAEADQNPITLTLLPDGFRQAEPVPVPPEGAITKQAFAELMRDLAMQENWCSEHHQVLWALDVEPLRGEAPFSINVKLSGRRFAEAYMGRLQDGSWFTSAGIKAVVEKHITEGLNAYLEAHGEGQEVVVERAEIEVVSVGTGTE